jgi:hypothetical protein
LNDKTWFDNAGTITATSFTWSSATIHDVDHLNYEATMKPPVFSRAWKINMPIYRRLERICRSSNMIA